MRPKIRFIMKGGALKQIDVEQYTITRACQSAWHER